MDRETIFVYSINSFWIRLVDFWEFEFGQIVKFVAKSLCTIFEYSSFSWTMVLWYIKGVLNYYVCYRVSIKDYKPWITLIVQHWCFVVLFRYFWIQIILKFEYCSVCCHTFSLSFARIIQRNNKISNFDQRLTFCHKRQSKILKLKELLNHKEDKEAS